MKAAVYGIDGKQKGEVSLPRQFSSAVRTDIIRRAVLAERSENRQPYGSDKLAGKRTSAHYHGLRRYRYTMMCKEMARLPRIHGRVGYLSFTARFAPQTVKGRRAHPPKVEKVWKEKINKKEWMKAFCSAIAASADRSMVASRNHALEGLKFPIVVEDRLQEIKKTSEAEKALVSLGLEKELDRTSERKVRAGRGKSRGRRLKERKGPLIVVAEDKGITKAASNIAGVEATTVADLSVEMLAPGTHPGRLCVWTESAIGVLAKTAK